MSFSSDIKKELCKIEIPRKQKKILIYGLLYGINGCEDGLIYLQTENKQVIDFTLEIFRSVYKELEPEITSQIKKNIPYYTIKIPLGKWQEKLINEYSLTNLNINTNVVNGSDVEVGVFLRGLFLSCGFATDPNKEYHIELFLHSEDKCNNICRLINEHGMLMKKSIRRGRSFLYTKESERTSDFLTYIGAMQQSMEIMNVKIYKEVRNNVNRTVNCESANLDKTIIAAEKQKQDITFILKEKGVNYLSDDLMAVAKIRLDNNDLTLRDIGEMLEPKISRSGVNHRLKKIQKIADELRIELGLLDSGE